MGPDIYSRFKDCIERQIAAYELMLNDYPQVDETSLEGSLESLLAQQTAWTSQTKDLEREFKVLLREWQRATGVEEAQRAEVEALSARTEQLAAHLVEQNAAVVARIDSRLKAVGEELGRVRKSRTNVGRYRSGGNEPDLMNKQI